MERSGMAINAAEMPVPSVVETEQIKKNIFKSAMKDDWKEVVKIYKKHPEVHKEKITRSGDTALHLAVLDGRDDIVKEMVGEAKKAEEENEALKVENEGGNTPLHLAAAYGNANMCECIAEVDPKLIGARNLDGETPFFLAALSGNKDAFLCLHHKFHDKDEGYLYCRRNDGDTILHSAISEESFDLAFQIIHLYDKLVNYVNEQGFTPLHILASKPSAFRSGSHLGLFHKIIYHCTFVDELEVETTGHRPQQNLEEEKQPKHPVNYQTCIDIFQLFSNMFHVLLSVENERLQNRTDTEKQANKNRPMFPPNYHICFEFIKFMSKALLIILGLGSREIKKIQTKKEKYIWSLQVMNKLLDHSLTYEYENTGREPQGLQQDKDSITMPYKLTNDLELVTPPVVEVEPVETSTNSPAKNSSEATQKKEDVMPYEMKITISVEKWKGSGSIMVEKKDIQDVKKKDIRDLGKKETPILIAAKNGITEMVEKILELYPVAIHDMNSDKKNIVLLAVKNRQPHVYQFLLNRKNMKDSIFRQVDIDGNNALHLAAMLGGEYRPWLIPGAALQMQWEIKWFEFVKTTMPLHFFARYNKKGEVPKDILKETHKDLVKTGGEWLTSTSQSCSVVAALIATVAFATSSTFPGGFNEKSGKPNLEDKPPFDVFAISSLVALSFSVTALVMFLAILTSRYQERDFGTNLPKKLLFGLTSLFVSIAAILISFCAGHFFVLKEELKFAAFPVYAVTCLPVTFFAIAQFPLYFDLIRATFKKVPQRSYKVVAT